MSGEFFLSEINQMFYLSNYFCIHLYLFVSIVMTVGTTFPTKLPLIILEEGLVSPPLFITSSTKFSPLFILSIQVPQGLRVIAVVVEWVEVVVVIVGKVKLHDPITTITTTKDRDRRLVRRTATPRRTTTIVAEEEKLVADQGQFVVLTYSM